MQSSEGCEGHVEHMTDTRYGLRVLPWEHSARRMLCDRLPSLYDRRVITMRTSKAMMANFLELSVTKTNLLCTLTIGPPPLI